MALMDWWSRHVAYRLFDRRDGPSRLHLLAALQQTQWLAAPALEQRQTLALAQALDWAAKTVPHYASVLPASCAPSDARAVFARLPILRKDDVRVHRQALTSRQIAARDMREARTGGSTGTALTLNFDRTCEAHRVAAAWRSDGWAGWTPGTPRAAVWGNPPVPTTARARLRSRLYDRTIYLDTMHLSPASMRAFFDQYQATRPTVLFGHSRSLYMLASFLEQDGRRPHPPRGIVSTSMMLLGPERAVIERVFGATVSNRYGCEEVGLIASQCEHHTGLHVNVDHVLVELLDDAGVAVPPGTVGNVVVTDLINRAMPLFRYAVGDQAVWSEAACPCGRALPMLDRIVGRTADYLVRPDGTLVAGVSLIERTLTAVAGIVQMQLVQHERHRLTIKVQTTDVYTPVSEQRLLSEFAAAFGPDMQFRVEHVERLDQTGAGKYRFSICTVNADTP